MARRGGGLVLVCCPPHQLSWLGSQRAGVAGRLIYSRLKQFYGDSEFSSAWITEDGIQIWLNFNLPSYPTLVGYEGIYPSLLP